MGAVEGATERHRGGSGGEEGLVQAAAAAAAAGRGGGLVTSPAGGEGLWGLQQSKGKRL